MLESSVMRESFKPLSYDSRGNLISKGDFTFEHDMENRLIRVKNSGDVIAEYWYDGLGNRVRSLENGEEIYCIYNGLNIIQEHNATANSRTDYIFAGIRRIAENTDGVVRYYHTDHLGSTRLITGSQGGIVAEYKYYPYGANLAQSIQDPGFDGAIYRFTGKGDSPNTGLYYFGARFYDLEIGRFITLYPARDGLNWYEYCGSNPLGYVDLWGLYISQDDPIWDISQDVMEPRQNPFSFVSLMRTAKEMGVGVYRTVRNVGYACVLFQLWNVNRAIDYYSTPSGLTTTGVIVMEAGKCLCPTAAPFLSAFQYAIFATKGWYLIGDVRHNGLSCETAVEGLKLFASASLTLGSDFGFLGSAADKVGWFLTTADLTIEFSIDTQLFGSSGTKQNKAKEKEVSVEDWINW